MAMATGDITHLAEHRQEPQGKVILEVRRGRRHTQHRTGQWRETAVGHVTLRESEWVSGSVSG